MLAMNVVGGGVLLILAVLTMAAADVGEVFCNNLNLLVATLPTNTSSSPQHFATATVGQAPDAVYALAQCRGDVVGDSACGDCIAGTLAKLNNQCYSAGYMYFDPCVVVFSNESFLLLSANSTGINGGTGYFERWNEKNITGDDADDVRLIAGLTRELLVETVEKAAGAAGRFGTGVMDSGRNFPLVRSLAQCTPDLSAGDCSACLRRIVGMVNSTMAVRMGGQVHVIRCFFRYETYVFYDGEPMVRLSSPAPAPAPAVILTNNKRQMNKLWVIPMVVVPLIVATFFFIFYRRLKSKRKGEVKLHQRGNAENLQSEERLVLGLDGKNSEFSVFEFDQILKATNNFSEENKLGQGGFGVVYQGHISGGMEIAVKRLASHSGQGFIEFKNEVQLIAKLQHRNLVRLLGCCSQGEEKILVYEYLPHKSLDFFIFDENKRDKLDWYRRLAIIEGISHGLLYLHKHSRLRVIHRDLKPSNILLDDEMNPKISDFGLARIFSVNDTEGNSTRRVVGTYGYMAPEYASVGIFSVKSDVFSYGVIVLEILSGKRNSGFNQCGNFINLIGYAWQLWEEGRWLELLDASLAVSCHSTDIMRCVNIALLCVQEKADDRPTMSDVVAMLSSKTMILVEPKHPAYFHVRVENEEPISGVSESSSINHNSISVIGAR